MPVKIPTEPLEVDRRPNVSWTENPEHRAIAIEMLARAYTHKEIGNILVLHPITVANFATKSEVRRQVRKRARFLGVKPRARGQNRNHFPRPKTKRELNSGRPSKTEPIRDLLLTRLAQTDNAALIARENNLNRSTVSLFRKANRAAIAQRRLELAIPEEKVDTWVWSSTKPQTLRGSDRAEKRQTL